MEQEVLRNAEETMEQYLQRVPIFRELSRMAICRLAECARVHDYEKGEIICQSGQKARCAYVLQEGLVSEQARDSFLFTMEIRRRKPGEHFGEMGVLLEEDYTTTVLAVEPSRVIHLPGERFNQAVWSNPCVGRQLIRSFRSALQNSFQKHISCVMFNAEGRLAYTLLMCSKENGQSGAVQLSQESLATRCGVSRQTISTILTKWKQAGVIKLSRCAVQICDAAALTDILLHCSQQA